MIVNHKLLKLVNKLFRQLLKGNMYEAIETNKEITKVLNTYTYSC